MRLINGPDGKPWWILFDDDDQMRLVPIEGLIVTQHKVATPETPPCKVHVQPVGAVGFHVKESVSEILALLASASTPTADPPSLVEFVEGLAERMEAEEAWCRKTAHAGTGEAINLPFVYHKRADMVRKFATQCRTAIENTKPATPVGGIGDLVEWAGRVIEGMDTDDSSAMAGEGRAAIAKARGIQ